MTWQVKEQSSAAGDHAPAAPLSFLALAHQKLCLWKTNRALCQKFCPTFLLFQLFSRPSSRLLGRREVLGEPGQVVDSQAWASDTVACLRLTHAIPFPALLADHCLPVLLPLKSTFPQKRTQNQNLADPEHLLFSRVRREEDRSLLSGWTTQVHPRAARGASRRGGWLILAPSRDLSQFVLLGWSTWVFLEGLLCQVVTFLPAQWMEKGTLYFPKTPLFFLRPQTMLPASAHSPF